MKFIKKYTKIGDKRIRRKFAWLPVKVHSEDGCESRWMENVVVAQEYVGGMNGWENTSFIN